MLSEVKSLKVNISGSCFDHYTLLIMPSLDIEITYLRLTIATQEFLSQKFCKKIKFETFFDKNKK